MARKSTPKAKWWILTIPAHLFVPFLPESCLYIVGQLEAGNETGYKHWQVVVCLSCQQRMSFVKRMFGQEIHCEPTKSEAALQYVQKEETAVEGTRFELGVKPLRRNKSEDWNEIRALAKQGDLQNSAIPGDIYVRYYSSLCRIAKDHQKPLPRGPQEVQVFWGKSGTGKTRRVFEEISENEYYLKSTTTKWWDAYQGEEIVVLDEFRGQIDVTHLLRWLDRYPCAIEVKGGQLFLKTKKWYITSNLSPEEWYPTLDEETKQALLRRLTNITEFK
jgi:hypothetical protein